MRVAQSGADEFLPPTHQMLLSWEELAYAVARQRRFLQPFSGRVVLFQPQLEVDSIARLLALLHAPCTTVLLPEHDQLLTQRLRSGYPDGLELKTGQEDAFADESVLQSASEEDGWQDAPRGRVVVCSSGSTGTPKGLVLTAQALVRSATETSASWPSDAIVGLQLPLARVAGLGALMRGWVARASFLIAKPSLLPLLHNTSATHFSCVPSQMLRWWKQEPAERLEIIRDQAQEILVGGAAPSPDLVIEAQRQGWPIRLTYACTEASGTVAMTPPGRPHEPLEVLPHWNWRIDDGCLALQGPCLAEGRLTPSGQEPVRDQEGWWRTADVIKPEGYGFRWQRRADRLIISGGEKIPPETIETWLTDRGCSRAWVIGVPHAEWGERPIAFVAGAPLPYSDLLHRMQVHLGKRFAVDAILDLPADLMDRDKLPWLQLRNLWAQSCSVAISTNSLPQA